MQHFAAPPPLRATTLSPSPPASMSRLAPGKRARHREAYGRVRSGTVTVLAQLHDDLLPPHFAAAVLPQVLPCPHGYRHSWTHCPFAHVGETARRRCPRSYSYLPEVCPNAKAKRPCPASDACPYSHNTFEHWLHPSRCDAAPTHTHDLEGRVGPCAAGLTVGHPMGTQRPPPPPPPRRAPHFRAHTKVWCRAA